MNKIEEAIINMMKALYKINEKQEKALIESFWKTSDEDKKEILKVLIESFEQREKDMKNILNKLQKMDIKVDEFKDHLSADKILEQII